MMKIDISKINTKNLKKYKNDGLFKYQLDYYTREIFEHLQELEFRALMEGILQIVLHTGKFDVNDWEFMVKVEAKEKDIWTGKAGIVMQLRNKRIMVFEMLNDALQDINKQIINEDFDTEEREITDIEFIPHSIPRVPSPADFYGDLDSNDTT